MRVAVLACSASLAAGLGIGLIAASGGSADGGRELEPAGLKLERLATPAVGTVSVPALKLPARPARTTTITPPPPVVPPAPVPPPVVLPPPPPPPPPPVTPPDGGRRPS